MSSSRRGFTLIELTIVVLIVATLAGIGFPHLQRAILRARAVDAVSDLQVVRVATLTHHADRNGWPDDVDRGVAPPTLEEYLPSNFAFSADDWVLDFDNWSVSDPDLPGLVGVTLITDDRDLGLMVMELLGARTWTNDTDKYTWVIEWKE